MWLGLNEFLCGIIEKMCYGFSCKKCGVIFYEGILLWLFRKDYIVVFL